MSGPTTTKHIHQIPETESSCVRQTSDGRQLEYRLTVLQQPERARACGQGAKSHADRRPVDPPPVVELRIFQNGADGGKSDITFSHNSNFFLFATLEQARPIAPARGLQAQAAQPAPVLTGVPVSGMAYLDRPSPAGYFIFPDLSVRHEGKYRLRFALYEETKDVYEATGELEPREFMAHRLDVKSKAFTVFSAKKFPGLAESTSLSRIVAEQGCRVRIRRDVRMRRRPDKPGHRHCSEEVMDETAMLRANRAHSPDQYAIEREIQENRYHEERKRSESNASVSSGAHDMYGTVKNEVKYERNFTPAQNMGAYPPPPPPTQSSTSSHLSFGGSSHPAPPAPPSQIHPPQIHPQDMYQQQSHYTAPAPAQPRQHQYPPANNYSRDAPSAQPSRRPSVDDYSARRDSTASYAQPPSSSHYNTPSSYQQPQTPVYNNYQQQPSYGAAAPREPQQPTTLPAMRLPSLSTIEPSWNLQPSTPTGNSSQLPKLSYPAPSNSSSQPPRALAPASSFPSFYTAPTPVPASDSKKRAWNRVFDATHTEGPMHNGMRPAENETYGAESRGYNPELGNDEGEDSYDPSLQMKYRRADGIEIIRGMPGGTGRSVRRLH